MNSAGSLLRAGLPFGLMVAFSAIGAALPARSQINPPQVNPSQTEPMQQAPATGTLLLPPPNPIQTRDGGPVVTIAPEGAELRMLDEMSGKVADRVLAPGGSTRLGSLTVSLQECRYPVDDPASNAYAYLIIRDDTAPEPLFRGWMIADSPALNALDHPRYDVWVLHCAMTRAGEGSGR